MKEKSSTKYNLIMNYLLQISNFIFPLITYPYISRVLGADGLGKVSFANSVTTYFAALATFGISTYAVRTCAKVRDDAQKLSRTAQELVLANGLTSVIAILLLIPVVIVVPRFRGQWILMLLFGIAVATEFLGMNWFYVSIEKFRYITIRSLVFKSISLLLIFLLVRNKSDYLIYALITVSAMVGSNLVNFIHSRKYISHSLKFPFEIRQHYHYTKWFFIQSVALTLFFNMDITMLGFLSTDSQVGNYEMALKIKYLLSTLVSSLGTFFLPRLSNDYVKKNMKAYWHTVEKSLRYICFITVPMVGFIWMEAGDIINLLGGEEYRSAADILRGLVVVVFFIGLSTVTGTQILLSMEKEKCVFLSILSGSAVNVILNIALIPRYQAMGAAYATILSEIVVLAVQLFFIRRQNLQLHISEAVKKPVIGTIPAFLGMLILNHLFFGSQLHQSGFIRLLSMTGLYGLIYAGILFLIREEIFMELFHMVIKRGKNEYL